MRDEDGQNNTTPNVNADMNAKVNADVNADANSDVALEGLTAHDQTGLLKSLWHNSSVGMCVLAADSRFLAVNDTLCSWFERTRADLLERHFIDLMPLDDDQRQETYRTYREMMQLEFEPVPAMWAIQTARGQVRQLQTQSSLFRDEQGQVRCMVMAHLTEKTLDGAEEMHYRSLIEQQNQFLVTRWLPQDGTLTFVNQAYAAFFGVSREACIGQKITEVLSGEAKDTFLEQLSQYKKQDVYKTFVRKEYRQDASGQWRCLRWVNEPIFDDRGQVRFFQGMGIDISEQVAQADMLTASESRYREVVDVSIGSVYSYFCYPPSHTSPPLISQDTWVWVRDWQPTTPTHKLTGYTLSEMDALGGYPALVHPEDQAAFADSRRGLQAGDVRTAEYRIINKAGTVLWTEDLIKVVADSYQGRPCLRVYGSNRNITERKQVEGILQAALDEKDIMLKEIHHRVKNNMQVISSLLALQSHDINDTRVRQAFAESRQRILAMAEVHKKLYESPDLAGINFLNYLGYLLRTFGAMHREVSAQVQLTGDTINVGIEQAVPLGLIANELLSNVYKHAFPAGQVSAPQLEVGLQLEPPPNEHPQVDGQHLTLSITDNGVGTPDILRSHTDSLGMTIVQALVDQLDAQVQFTAGIAGAGIAIRVQCLWLQPPTKTDTSQFFISHASHHPNKPS